MTSHSKLADSQQAEAVVGVPDVGRWLLMLRGAPVHLACVTGVICTGRSWQPWAPELSVEMCLDASAGCGEKENLYWDPLQGTIMDAQAYAEVHPGVLAHRLGEKQLLLHVWTDVLQTAMVAHQRRGDSDAVAHCFHQLLAVDLADPGWAVVLQS